MEIILSKQCLSLAGTLGQGYGYFIVKRKKGFFSVRSKYGAPPDGHWRFIVLCAELAQNKLHITDIRVTRQELIEALNEAHLFVAAQNLKMVSYYARDIINLKTTFSL
jgi:hypothetical protein